MKSAVFDCVRLQIDCFYVLCSGSVFACSGQLVASVNTCSGVFGVSGVFDVCSVCSVFFGVCSAVCSVCSVCLALSRRKANTFLLNAVFACSADARVYNKYF